MTPAIVVLGYNRIKSIMRLLKTLDKAVYPSDAQIPLVIDLDNCGSDDIYNACNEFEWTHGEKRVVLRPERMGLREHVLACGDLSYEYGSVIMFEDDMMVSPMFYMYASAALNFCHDDSRIGGVSLYNHLFNVHARRNFAAIDDGYDNWYFQFASSWGQAYTGEQWRLFREWYETHKDDELTSVNVPENVSSWSAKSWLKYHICYLIDTDRYFMYPRLGYSTNCGDAGSHFARANTDLQIPLAGAGINAGDVKYCEDFRFATLDQSRSVYDAFFENKLLAQEGVLVDLYGLKNIEGILESDEKKQINKILTSKCLPYEVIGSYGRYMRPIDANIYYEMDGNDYYLYDVTHRAAAPNAAGVEATEYLYEYRGISLNQMKKIIGFRIREKFSK